MKKKNENLAISDFNLLKKFFLNLSKKQKLLLGFVYLVMALSAIGQSLSILVFLPFINLLVNFSGDIYEKINYKLPFLEIDSQFSIFSSGLIVIGAISISTILQILNLQIYTKFYANEMSSLSTNIYKSYSSLDYKDHIKVNTSKYLNLSTTQLEAAGDSINCTLQFFTSLLISISIVISIVIANFWVGTTTILIFGFIFYFLSIRNKAILLRNSKKISYYGRSQIKCVQESLASKRDLIIYGLNDLYSEIFNNNEFSLRKVQTKSQLISLRPRFIIEGLCLIFLVLFSMILTFHNKESNAALISLIGTYALASQKLISSLQKVYGSWAVFRSRSDSFCEVLKSVEELHKKNKQYKSRKINKNFRFQSINFDNSIKLENVNYSYENNNLVLKNINLEIIKGEKIGIFGKTGCGKSTLQDILLGLLKPNSGNILIDNIKLDHDNRELISSWYSLISHVPQSIYITDDSIRNNISISNLESKDFSQIKKVAKISMIDDFIKSLPLGYETRLGENGILISGGQKQRIAIARALYRNPSILFLDEATSALDTNTESELMRRIDSLKNITIIMIAHRINTLKYCDRVFKIDNGELKQVELEY